MSITVHEVTCSTPETIAAKHQSLTFGETFTDRMFRTQWTTSRGWHDAEIVPYGPIELDPAANVLQYAQQAFEGLKAHRLPDGRVATFRAEQHAERLDHSAERLCMPTIGRDRFLEAVETLVDLERAWVPSPDRGTLYIRPTLIGTEAALGVRVSEKYLFYIIACPVGAYFPRGFKPLTIHVEPQLVRAAVGGIGFTKSAGNYAASLLAGQQAQAHGCDQVLFLDACEHRYLEELGGMNVFCVIDGVLVTPPLGGSILAGVTRNSILKLAPTLSYQTAERPIAIEEVLGGLDDGRVTEMFAVGTAAVVTAIGSLCWHGRHAQIGNGDAGPVARALYEHITAIHRGEIADPFGWLHIV